MSDKGPEKKTDHKGKKRILPLAAVILVLAACGVGVYLYRKNLQVTEQPQMPFPPIDSENVVSATGTTSTGLVKKEISLDFPEADLMVEEVYVSSSDEVEDGTAVLKLTDNSYREAYRELERAQIEAELAYRQGKLDYENAKLEAHNTQKQSAIASGFAQIAYDDALLEAQIMTEKAEQEVKDAQETVDEYTDGIENDAYREEYEVDEKKAAYDKNMALFFEKLEDYGYELDDDDDDDPNTFNIVKKDGTGGGSDGGRSDDGESAVLSMLKAEYQENKEEYPLI